jgi:hypothetical protein
VFPHPIQGLPTGWGNSQRGGGAAPRHDKLPPPGPGLLIRQASIAYGNSSPASPGADTPTPVSRDAAPTRADRQRHKIPIYNLTTGQPALDVRGEGNLTLNSDNSAFHSLFPDAELAIVRIPKPPDRASPVEVIEHQARMHELIE